MNDKKNQQNKKPREKKYLIRYFTDIKEQAFAQYALDFPWHPIKGERVFLEGDLLCGAYNNNPKAYDFDYYTVTGVEYYLHSTKGEECRELSYPTFIDIVVKGEYFDE